MSDSFRGVEDDGVYASVLRDNQRFYHACLMAGMTKEDLKLYQVRCERQMTERGFELLQKLKKECNRV